MKRFLIIGLLVLAACEETKEQKQEAAKQKQQEENQKQQQQATYLGESLSYYKDTRTNLCFATTSNYNLTYVPCSEVIEKRVISFPPKKEKPDGN